MTSETKKTEVGLLIRVPPEVRRKFKVLCAQEGVSMQSLFEKFIDREIKKAEARRNPFPQD